MLFGSTCVSLGSSLTSDLVSSRFGAAFFFFFAFRIDLKGPEPSRQINIFASKLLACVSFVAGRKGI